MGVKRDHRFKFFCLGFMNSIQNPKQSFLFFFLDEGKKARCFVERERERASLSSSSLSLSSSLSSSSSVRSKMQENADVLQQSTLTSQR